MSKKGTRALASATLMSVVLTTALSAGTVQAAQGRATRLGEADRYATAAKVATSNWDKAETVVLVNGEGYADAVSGSVLAKKLDAPMLLTAGNALSAETKTALESLGTKKVYVVGGNASVSVALETALKANYTVTRLGGANRYETNTAVAEELVKLGVDPANVMMVGGEGFSDALSVAPIAAAKDQILLLGMNDANYMSPVVDFVKKHNSKVTVVGTKNVISDAIYSAVGATSRIDGGADRWDTNQKVLAAFKDTVKFDKLYVASAAYNAQDNGFADALVASALAGKYAAPLVLVDKDGSTGTSNALAYIKANASKTTDLNVVGGTGVVSDAVLNAITKAVNPVQTGDNTVASVSAINLNQFDVVFNTNVDEDTAELASNYKVAGIDLHDDYKDAEGSTVKANAHAELINDNTVRVTLVDGVFNLAQGAEKTVSVKKGILTADKTKTIEKFDQKVEFSDITTPTLKDVSVRGNNKLVIEFSEAVNMSNLDTLKSLIQVNDKNLSNIDLKVKEAATNGTETWASKVEIYFNSGLNSGENTVKVKDAKDGILADAASFGFKEASKTFTVDKVTTAPTIKEVTATDDGEVRVKFDRAMDSKTATSNKSYYSINGTQLTDAKLELKDNDTTIKITNIPAGVLKDNVNVLEVKKEVKDAYGNKLTDDTRVSFNKEKDEIKPTVVSANILDSKTLRIQFSEDVNSAYATNLENYELRDAYNVDLITKGGVEIVPAGAETGNTDTYDITFTNASNVLNGAKYTLTIKNIVDTATEPNKMDNYTVVLDGNDDQAPRVAETFIKGYDAEHPENNTKIAIFFNKEMDQASLSNRANYYYINGNGETKDLPEDADITVSADNKGVVIDFEDANKTVVASDANATGDDKVKQIGIKNLEDISGNVLYGGAQNIVTTSSTTLKVQDKTLKLFKDGDDVKAQFQLDTALDTIDVADFALTSADGATTVEASDVDFDGKTVILTFKDVDVTEDGVTTNAAKDAEALGVNAKLAIVKTGSEDIAGHKINTELSAAQSGVQYSEIALETDRDAYTATLATEGVNGGAKVTITMNTVIDADIQSSYKDDFVFISNGVKLDVADAQVSGNTIVFTVQNPSIKVGSKIEVTAATDASKIDIRTAEDGDGKHIKFVPSSDDAKVKSVDVK